MLHKSSLIEALHLTANADGNIVVYDDEIENALRAIRMHLGMEIGFVSEFLGEERIFRHVDTGIANPPLQVGQRLSMDEGYCRMVVAGELPELIPDTSLVPAALAIPATRLLPIGSHMSVPIRLSDGSVYGTFCCFSSVPDASLRVRDLQTMRAVADMIASQVEGRVLAQREHEHVRTRVETALIHHQPRIVYQPIVRLSDMETIGTEALSRFDGPAAHGPDRWFSDAATVGLRAELELAALRNALKNYGEFWQQGWYLALNVSPQTVIDRSLTNIFAGFPLDKIVLELTEHERVEDYDALASRLADLRAGGLRVAVDDAGSGYASLRHVLNIRPDIIKLDISLTRDIDLDPVRQALGAAIVNFGGHVGCKVIAEGIETQSQMAALQGLGINLGQGYLLAKPTPPEGLGRTMESA